MIEEDFANRGYEHDGIVYGDGWNYHTAVSAQSLRSGVDGPHVEIADEFSSLRRDCL